MESAYSSMGPRSSPFIPIVLGSLLLIALTASSSKYDPVLIQLGRTGTTGRAGIMARQRPCRLARTPRLGLRLGSQADSVQLSKKKKSSTPAPVPEGWMLAEPMVGVGPFVLKMRQKDVIKHIKGPWNVTADGDTARSVKCTEDGIDMVFCGIHRLDHIALSNPSKVITPQGVTLGMTLDEVKEKVGPMVKLDHEELGGEIDLYFSRRQNGVAYSFNPERQILSTIMISTDYDSLSDLREMALKKKI